MEHICSSRSDNLPIMLWLGSRREWRPIDARKTNIFRYEHIWERQDSLQAAVMNTWRKEGPARNLQKVNEKLKAMQKELREWAEHDFGSALKEDVAN